MLGVLLKWTDAEHRAAIFRRDSWRIGRIIWTPVFVVVLIASWYFALTLRSGYAIGIALSISASGVMLLLKRHY